MAVVVCCLLPVVGKENSITGPTLNISPGVGEGGGGRSPPATASAEHRLECAEPGGCCVIVACI